MLIATKKINIKIEISSRPVIKKTPYDVAGVQAAQVDKVASWKIK